MAIEVDIVDVLMWVGECIAQGTTLFRGLLAGVSALVYRVAGTPQLQYYVFRRTTTLVGNADPWKVSATCTTEALFAALSMSPGSSTATPCLLSRPGFSMVL